MSKFPKHKKPRKKPIRISKIIRQAVINRDGGMCRLCHKPATQIHHIMTKAHSGNDTSMNLICVCSSCHRTIHRNEKKWFKILFNMQKEHYKDLTIEKMKK